MAAATDTSKRNYVALVLLGLAVGCCSGLFGLGGGVVVVPVLTFVLGYGIKLASGTSLLAIMIPAIVGVITYGLNGHVHVVMAALLACGSIVGAPVGTWVLSKVRPVMVQWAYVVFLLCVIASMFLVTPARDSEVVVDALSVVLLVGVGFIAGIASGLLGIGGGMVVVPLMMLVFGASDLVAKGTSLLMIIATSLSGTVSNALRRNVDVPAALVIGCSAAVATPASVLLVHVMTPFAANMAFAVFVGLLVVRMLFGIRAERRRGAASESAG